MGINGLNPFLKKRCPQVYSTIYLEQLSGTTIAFDAMNIF